MGNRGKRFQEWLEVSGLGNLLENISASQDRELGGGTEWGEGQQSRLPYPSWNSHSTPLASRKPLLVHLLPLWCSLWSSPLFPWLASLYALEPLTYVHSRILLWALEPYKQLTTLTGCHTSPHTNRVQNWTHNLLPNLVASTHWTQIWMHYSKIWLLCYSETFSWNQSIKQRSELNHSSR